MQTRPWETIDNFGVNRLPARATFSPAVGGNCPCEASASLGGDWLFHFDPSPEAAPQGFEAPDFDDSEWETAHFPIGSNGYDAPYYSLWDGENNSIFIRREFYIDIDPSLDTYKFYVRHDDDYKVYINGKQVDTQTGAISTYRTARIAPARLCVGRNVIAVQAKQFTGAAYFDCGVLSIIDATGLKEIEGVEDSKDLIYNIAGQRLNKLQKGINIVGGRKVLIK